MRDMVDHVLSAIHIDDGREFLRRALDVTGNEIVDGQREVRVTEFQIDAAHRIDGESVVGFRQILLLHRPTGPDVCLNRITDIERWADLLAVEAHLAAKVFFIVVVEVFRENAIAVKHSKEFPRYFERGYPGICHNILSFVMSV